MKKVKKQNNSKSKLRTFLFFGEQNLKIVKLKPKFKKGKQRNKLKP